ncbi:CoA transferase [Actinosynnema mirum]|uniref:L-carnitine dehydratase/bile acid-inducible protein F n=1 Tax=Actinosynnema mirum (strain ATCC 29888 / DSM 43827 / JCM 3225 / NBRC 14064 / NCIMB 13271 / NRRL B-12336 / IMRU 3971 / 101) TaxID=446462 RepID=C6WD88_ACTMD|nr:CoA transferase [Actinosynnema mirum]ACU37707.1 L-carnitine dehydratase/bile acid-inducible protein F [Actinosynnema mirum DSM 43827]
MTALLDALSWAGPVDLPLECEADVQAACGLMHVHGRALGGPARLGLDYASALAGELAGLARLAVELSVARGGPVRGFTTSVAQAGLLAVSQYLAAATASDDGAPPEVHAPGGPPFTSAEGAEFELEALDAGVWLRFWTSAGASPSAVASGWRPFLHRFATASCPLPAELHAVAAGHPLPVLRALAEDTGMTLVRVAERRLADLPAHRVAALGGAASGPLPPAVGALPLDGLVVLESCRRVQGPLAGHLLRMLGASVVRLEPPGGDPLRFVPPVVGGPVALSPVSGVPVSASPVFGAPGAVPPGSAPPGSGMPAVSARFHALNRGKGVAFADLSTPDGRERALELARGADVFLHNWGPGRQERWRLGGREVAAARPGIVHAHASGWGDELGPTPPLGTDYAVQAHAGVPRSLMTLVDVFGGVVCARAVLDGLLRRVRSGSGQVVGSSLLSAASRLNAVSGLSGGAPSVPVCQDLAALARDPAFARAVEFDGCALPVPPWEFLT